MNKEEMLKEKEENLIEDNRTLEEIIKEVADEEGIPYEQAMKLFLKGMKEANGIGATKPKRDRAKVKKKRKLSKASRKKNR